MCPERSDLLGDPPDPVRVAENAAVVSEISNVVRQELRSGFQAEDGGRTPPDCKVLVSLLVARVGRIREALTMPAAVGRVRWNRAAGERCVRCARRDEMSYARRLRRPRRVSG